MVGHIDNKKLIKRYITDREDIRTKLDVYYGFDRITREQYEELLHLTA